MSIKITRISNLIIEHLIKGLVIILPLFFLPAGSAGSRAAEWLEFNKLCLFGFVLLLIAALWLVKAAAGNEITIRRTPLDIPILIFLFITGASIIFSVDKYASFFGNYGRFGDSWPSLLSCIFFYFIIVNFVSGGIKIAGLIDLLLYSSGAVVIIQFLSVTGVWEKLFGNSALALPSASAGSSAVFIAANLIILSGVLFFSGEKIKNKLKRLDFLYLFFVFALSIFILARISFSSLGADERKLSGEIRPDRESAVAIAAASVRENPLLGSGIGTYGYDFSRYRRPQANQSPSWQLRFGASYSQILQWASTIGVLGLLSYFLLIALFFYLVYAYFKEYKTEIKEKNILSGLLGGFLIIFITQFFYPSGAALWLMFWLLLALITARLREAGQAAFKDNVFSFSGIAGRTSGLSGADNIFLAVRAVLLAAAGAGIVASAALMAKNWTAEYYYGKIPRQEENLIRAVELNPNRVNYQLSLAKLYLDKAKGESSKPAGEGDEVAVKTDIENSLAWAGKAVAASPNSVAANETLGMIYRDIGPLASGSGAWAAEYFKRAYELEPSNPVLACELAKAYAGIGDFNKAEQYFKQSLGLKNDYYDAKFSLAKTYAKQDKKAEAIAALDELAPQADDAEVYYELGRLYYNSDEIEKAISNFLKALEARPDHSNSLYSLGLAYQLKGDNAKALMYFEKVLELNPGNEDVVKKINSLKK